MLSNPKSRIPMSPFKTVDGILVMLKDANKLDVIVSDRDSSFSTESLRVSDSASNYTDDNDIMLRMLRNDING